MAPYLVLIQLFRRHFIFNANFPRRVSQPTNFNKIFRIYFLLYYICYVPTYIIKQMIIFTNKLHPTSLSSHQHRELMASLKIERKPQANFWSIISRFPPPHIFLSEGENTNYAEAFFIPRIFSEFASRLSTASPLTFL